MKTINNFSELKSALNTKETSLYVTDKELLKKMKVAMKAKRFAPAIVAATGLGAASLIAGPVGWTATGFIATPTFGLAAISTGTSIALLIAAVTVIALVLNYNVEFEFDGQTVKVKYKNG